MIEKNKCTSARHQRHSRLSKLNNRLGSFHSDRPVLPEHHLPKYISTQPSHSSGHLFQFQNEIDLLRKQNEKLKKERDDTVESSRTLHKQHQHLHDSFKLLREKYDDLKAEIHHILWDYIPSSRDPEEAANFSELSNVNHAVFETSDRVGDYAVGSVLGEGQFADVKSCMHTVTKKHYAMKFMSKKKVTSISGLTRIKNEIHVLRLLDHPNIIRFVEVINSPQWVYLITEVGGKDLFEFFNANPHGVANKVSQQIILGIVKPLVYLHALGICHRDLKPENILLYDDGGGSQITYRNIQICDFGQSGISSKPDDRTFSDLCGSPGFFAPEMILCEESRYNGFAADVWSVGCIMLELTRGHDDFCKLWMTSYDYDILQDEQEFKRSLNGAVSELNAWKRKGLANAEKRGRSKEKDLLSEASFDFLMKMLVIEPTFRIHSSEMLCHPWLNVNSSENIDSTSDAGSRTNESKNIPNSLVNFEEEMTFSADSDATLSQSSENATLPRSPKSSQRPVKGKRNLFRDSLSSRARKHFASSNEESVKVVFASKDEEGSSFGNDNRKCAYIPLKATHRCRLANKPNQIEIRLPPIEPKTP